MFGQSSAWGQQNNQQQGQQQGQQQQGGLFGAGGSTFGQQNQTTGGFGQNTGGFGQPAQQNTGGGLFGGGTTQPSTGFGTGGFGAPATTGASTTFGSARPTFGATGTSTFGASGNTSGGSLFGSTNNNTSTFGQQNTGGGLFGKPANTGFGTSSTSTLFGARPANTSPFGGNNSSPSANQVQQYNPGPWGPPPTTGTANPPYQATWQQDPSATGAVTAHVPPHLFHVISAMEPYRGASLEELRLMDYQQNRKDASSSQAAPTGFGQPAAGGFGQPATTGTFGQPPAAASSSFGAPKPAGGLFGNTSTTGGFGSTSTGFGTTGTTGGLFGQQNQQQPATSNPFGAQTSTTGGGLFGQPQQNQPATGGLFSNPNPFGGNSTQQPTQQPASTAFSFGAPKPAFGATGTTGFGAPNTAATNTFGQSTNTGATGFGGFGQTQQPNPQPQPAATGGLFGSGGGFGTNTQPSTGGGLFGQPNQQASQPAAGGLFGNTAKPGGLFGNPGATNAGGSGGFSFGQTNNTTQPPSTGGLFGSQPAAPNTGTGLFGQTQQTAQQPAAGGGLFGNTGNTGSSLFAPKPAGTNGGLFGSQPPQQPAQTGSLFGNSGQTNGLFGSSTNNALGTQNGQQNQAKPGGLFGGGSSLFGNQQQQQTQPGSTGGLFSSMNQQQPTSSLFGSQPQQNTQQPALGGSLFGGGGFGQSTLGQLQQQQGNLTASIDQNPYGRNDLFQYTGQKLDLGTSVKKPALPPLTSSTFRLTPTKSQLNKLRGFSSPLTTSQGPSSPLNTLSSPNRAYIGSPSGGDRYRGLSDTALTPNAFVPRPSIKKLTVHSRASGSGEDKLESVLGKSSLKSSSSTPRSTPAPNGAAASPATLVFNPPANGSTSRPDTDANSPVRRGIPLDSPRVSGSERQLKKGEYWCKPKLEKLRQLPQSELRAIRNFTAGRKGYGEVSFFDPVDLTGLNFDALLGEIIKFSEQELSVYDEDFPNKPPVGKGLNVPARVSLENIYIKDKASKKLITDPEDSRYLKFAQRVKHIPNTKYVSYEDGVWTFDVEHFSKYGIPDSDDEVEDEANQSAHEQDAAINGSSDGSDGMDEDFLPPTKGLRDETDEKSGSHSASGTENEEGIEEDDEDSATDVSSFEEEDSEEFHAPPEATYDPPTKINLGPDGLRKMREMQSSFFAQPPAATRGVINKHAEKEAVARVKRLLEDQKGFEFAGRDEIVSLDDGVVKRTSFGDAIDAPKLLRQPRKYARVVLEDSSLVKGDGARPDAGLALGRSFRCSWGPNGELVHSGSICRPGAIPSPSSLSEVFIETVPLLANEQAVESARAKRLLDLHLARSETRLIDNVPAAILDTSVRFHDFARLFDAGDRSHEANIWRLGVALFDEINLGLPAGSTEELTERAAEIRRKLALSKWLEDAVASSVDHDLLSANGSPEKIFTLLSGNQIERAVQTAIDGNDMRLATLVSQIGGPEAFREEITRQLEDWKKYKVNPLLSTGYRRLYALLAGIMDVSPGDASRGSDGCPDVIISKNLDWKRAFGLRLWFGNPFEQTITDILSTFSSDLQNHYPPAKPLPSYLEKPEPLPRTWTMGSEPTDILYGLIKLYSDVTVSLEDVLRARDCSPSPLDARLPWHLYLILAYALQKRDFADRGEGYSATADGITSAYAAQLEEGGDWTYAAFVLLHLETTERETALKALLHRHPDATPDQRHFLVESLKVPVTWIHEAKAADLASREEVFDEYKELILAELYPRAHKLLIEKLAVEAIVRGDHALLRKLCGMLHGREPEGWEFGGKLFLDYLEITNELPKLWANLLRSAGGDQQERQRVHDLANSIPRVTQLLPSLFSQDDPQGLAALSEMLSELAYLGSQSHFAGVAQKAPSGGAGLVNLDRLQILQENAFNEFDKTISILPAAA